MSNLWFASHKKLRHTIFCEKLEIYKRLQTIATDALICIIPTEDIAGLEDKFKEITTDLFIELQKSSILIEDKVLLNGYEIWAADFKSCIENKQKFYRKFNKFTNSMREDLKVKSLHNITKILVPSLKIDKERIKKFLNL